MNRFLARKKEKKRQPEPKPQIDLTTALPAADDFRTSLIMPGLSTRFSMLREQDDPSSKIGKASDDSVLVPKRQSRLHEFGFAPGGLSDIAEVSSLHGSSRRLPSERKGSYDSHATDDGASSVMSRSRPGEGNVLFGGRQKVYKLSNTGTSQGKQLYDDDVHLSYFQKMRLQEKERLAAQEALERNSTTEEATSPGKDVFSPSADGFTKRRETSSSTNSGSNARISTAATSIASQGAGAIATAAPASPTELTRTTTKVRRLYDQGLDQQLHEQQSSAINRLNSIQRARGPGGRATPPLLYTQSRSATNLNDRFNRAPSRTESPTFSHSPAFPPTREVQSDASSPTLSRPQSPSLLGPLSPLSNYSEENQTLNTALQYQDRGKATAMGAFNKPKQAFSEEQYAERTKRMQQERDASTPKLEYPRKMSLRERAEMEKRKRAGAGSPEQSSPAPTAFSMFQSAATQMRASPTDQPPVPPKPTSDTIQSPDSQTGATFLTSAGSTDDEGEVTPPLALKITDRGRKLENLPTATGPAPPILEHPALRSRSNSGPKDHMEPPAVLEPVQTDAPAPLQTETATESKDPDVDSPTLGPNGGGLSGLVRQHLRNVSNVSSVYDDNQSVLSPPPTQTQHVGLQRRQPASEADSLTYSGYSHSNPWDLDDIESNPYYADRGSMSSVSPTSEMPKQTLPQPTNLVMSPTESTFPKDDEKTHQRGRSTEEHEALQSDLAKRQRAIQQSLRAKAEGRSTSPAPAPPTSSGGLKNALNMLRAKSSRESFATVDTHRTVDGSGKPLKKFGLGANANGSNISLGSEASRRPLRMRQQSETRQRSAAEESTNSRSRSSRERSTSPTSTARSASRPRTLYRDDLGQSMAEGVSVTRSSVYPVNDIPSMPGFAANATQPLPMDKPSPDKQKRLRSRSNSRTAAGKHLQPIQIGHEGSLSPKPLQFSPGLPVSPRPSPGGPSPNMNAFRPQGSPVPPFSASNTPPVSNPGTPVGSAFGSKSVVPPPMLKTGTLRKKSIAKADIGDPRLVSTTSVIDTISLADASIKNSMIHSAPPVPPINPMRRRVGTGKSEYFDPAVQHGLEPPESPITSSGRANSSDAVPSQSNFSKPMLRSAASEGKSLRGLARSQTDSVAVTSPPVPSVPFGRNNSPPRPIYDQPIAQKNMDGAMF
ncbi:unnamed protein product [Periconia digitata]|uniref:Uncharacterized protein n=1 Tax=Periconia digitata TaxID=1303443 RepID=A0A9W4UQB5_9PLEO|nr:unnamed protein product [Periconia digitata]